MRSGLSRFDLELLAGRLRVASEKLRGSTSTLLEACMAAAAQLTDREPNKATHDRVRALLAAYLDEFGEEATPGTFLDWVAAAVGEHGQGGGDARAQLALFEKRVAYWRSLIDDTPAETEPECGVCFRPHSLCTCAANGYR
jgi:hypothetical protein